MSTPHQLVASEIPSTVTSWETSGDAGTSSVRASRIRTGCGDGDLGDRRVGRGALGAGHLLLRRRRRLRAPVADVDVAERGLAGSASSGPIDGADRAAGDPSRAASRSRPATRSPAAGSSRSRCRAKQSPPADGAREREVGVARAPNEVVAHLVALREPQVLRRARGAARCRRSSWSSTRFWRDDVVASAVHDDPDPERGVLAGRSPGRSALLLSCTQLPAIEGVVLRREAARSRACSARCPRRLSRHSEFTIEQVAAGVGAREADARCSRRARR